MTTVLDLQSIEKSFGAVRAVDGVSFDVARGEIVALLGPSGCGKTTTLRLIAGFEQPDGGRIVMNGVDVALREPYERNVGLVFQDYALFPHMTVAQNIAFGMKHRGTPRAEIPKKTAEVLERVHLSGVEKRWPSQLSGGQQQRVALARALVTEPDLMLRDEPLSNLDAKLRHHLRIELREILSKTGSTTIIVTHDQEEAMGLADRIVLMNAGRIEQIDTPERLYAEPKTRFSADFIGQSNWFEGTVRGDGADGTAQVDTPAGPVSIPLVNGFAAGDRIAVCVRPERITLTGPDLESTAPGQTRVAGTVDAVEMLGSDIRVWLKTANGAQIQSSTKYLGGPRPKVGTKAAACFNAADCILLEAEGKRE